MNEPGVIPDRNQPKRRYNWPWFVLAGVVLGILLAIIWMSREVERTRRNRDLNAPLPASR